MRIYVAAYLAIILFVVNGCIPHQKLVNFQQVPISLDSTAIENAQVIKIQPNDVLSIKVYGSDIETSAPFNLTPVTTNDFFTLESVQLSGYLVDQEGSVDIPVIGKIVLKGKTIAEAREIIKGKLLEYLKEPVVNVRLLNFRVTVSGEVRAPGSFTIINERISLPEAIARAGDLTDYADRSNVLIVREEDGVRSTVQVNLLSNNLFKSEYFYLKQNDLIYVRPIQAKTGAVQDQTSKTVPIITAAATVLAVVLSITNNNN